MVYQGGVEMRIAIIEDDEITRLELSKLLNTQGYETVLLTDFGNLTDELKQYSIELVLLDINLPYENGYEVCRKIKQVMPVPIIFVTSRDTNADELKSIQVGGIDFITKPYDTLILLEKIKRALQLSNPNNFRELVKKDCTLDLHLSILKYQEQSIELTRNEFRILYYFFMNEDKVISKEELLEKLWNDKYYLDENVLLVNMTRLKKKMKEIGIVHLLENIRGYFVKQLQLDEVIHNVILKFRHSLMERKTIINIHDIENVIYTDEKWLTFILSQIVQNAIKYFDKQENKLTIYSQDNGTNILLVIEDNGCGIKASDLSRVFEKGFTGSNRNKANATGNSLLHMPQTNGLHYQGRFIILTFILS